MAQGLHEQVPALLRRLCGVMERVYVARREKDAEPCFVPSDIYFIIYAVVIDSHRA